MLSACKISPGSASEKETLECVSLVELPPNNAEHH
jgi:hypothetical protein